MADSFWRDRKVFISGVCGTVGRELLTQVLASGVSEVTGLDNNESELFFLEEEYRGDVRARFSLGDVRDRDTLTARIRGCDVVLHAAALKHVSLCEASPGDAIETNIRGVQNIIEASLAGAVARVLFTSSDKAVNPTNVMGTSKLMGERLMTAANASRRGETPVFVSTRFGNVLGSRGSVIPLFLRQIAAGGPLTLTDPEMTRFIMTLSEAVKLVMDSASLARGGEAFVTKMPVVRIEDLARVMVEECAPRYGYRAEDIEVRVIGSKPGEKLYEELMNVEEVRRAVELDRYFVVRPAFQSLHHDIDYTYPHTISDRVSNPYNSAVEPALSKEALRVYLRESGLLDVPRAPAGTTEPTGGA
ncbi:MAG: polysaccharide biosynthesis protein [Nannocystaceae bacterium]